jgi:ABC-type uncharacterized transport system ATPase subunit
MEKGSMVRSGKIEEIVAAESQQRVVRLAWLGDAAALVKTRLEGNTKVSGLMVSGAEGVFKFSGSEEELATLLADLVAGGVRVVAFSEVKQTVEDLYMKLSGHEVM